MTTTTLTTAQKRILAKMQHARCCIECVRYVFATPPGGWPETRQAEGQAEETLPAGVTLAAAMDAVLAAGLVGHIHPDRAE